MAYSFDWNGTEYTLEFDRKTVVLAEDALGLTLNDIREPKLSTMEKLFHAALLKHHPKIKPNVVEELYELQDDKQGLFADLLEMYVETVNSLLNETPKGKGITRKKS